MASKKLASLSKLILISLFFIAIVGLLLSLLPREVLEGHNRNFDEFAKIPSYQAEPENLSNDQPALKELFDKATLLMQNNQYDQSIALWQQVLIINSKLPEAHVNMGFVLLELNRLGEAQKSFEMALEFRPEQANGYYGLAEVYEQLNMLPEAIGSMRTFLHLSNNEIYKTKARSALWEWQEKLKQNQQDP